MVSLHKHKVQRQDRNTGKHGGGLLLYIHDNIYDYTNVISEYSTVSLDLEQLWIVVECPNVRKKVIGLTYRPPRGNVENCLESLRNTLDKIHIEHDSEITVIGDLNINYKTTNTTPFRLLKEIERDFGSKQLITAPTRTCNIIYTNRFDIDRPFSSFIW